MEDKENQQYRDSVFTDLFQNNPKNFLSLYNAIHDTNLKLSDVNLEPKRLDQSLYHTMYNDVSMLINGRWIVLIEHQSTINENMPVRLLNYVSRIYEKLLRLSDAYITHTQTPMLELEVTVFNIYKPTAERCLNILNKCDILKQYCMCIDTIRRMYDKNNPHTYDAAIDECRKRGYLGDYLIQATKGKRNMLFTEYDYETDLRVQKQESFEEGAAKKAEEDALAFLREGDSIEKISRCINIPIERVRELAEQIKQ